MSAIVFDGRAFAREREGLLARRILGLGARPRIATIVFKEDEAGVLYTRLKKQVAVRVGVEFSEQEASISESLAVLQDRVRVYCQRADLQGVLIQKPAKGVWEGIMGLHGGDRFETWWRNLVAVLEPGKDVDCLTEANLSLVYGGEWRVLPATVKAVVTILQEALIELGMGGTEVMNLSGKKIVVAGRSEIVGRPLAAVLEQYGGQVWLYGRDLDYGRLSEADVVIGATGVPGLIKGEMVREGAMVIDVGSPKGDVEFDGVKEKAAFITPVPGGVGPMTVISLLENLVELVERG